MIDKIVHAPELITKVNELVDAVNTLLVERREYFAGRLIGWLGSAPGARLSLDSVRKLDADGEVLQWLVATGDARVDAGGWVRLTDQGRERVEKARDVMVEVAADNELRFRP